jgi:hypothetical protein
MTCAMAVGEALRQTGGLRGGEVRASRR